jgi:NAD-dependent SIR2 family protein deacetylase
MMNTKCKHCGKPLPKGWNKIANYENVCMACDDKETIIALRDENERLREALRHIRDGDFTIMIGTAECLDLNGMLDVARAALKPTP